MTELDLVKLSALADASFVAKAEQTYGDTGVDRMIELLGIVREIFHAVPYESFTGSVLVAIILGEDEAVPEFATADLASVAELTGNTGPDLTVVRLPSGDLLAHHGAVLVEDLPGPALVFERSDGDEVFHVAGEVLAAQNPVNLPSVFGQATFDDLGSAVGSYHRDLARASGCLILSNCWRDPKRILFNPKPEASMRRSLYQFLKVTLRHPDGQVEVRQEQNVDETHPVDIKVAWPHGRIALIEVKWMGKSAGKGPQVVDHNHARAKAGLAQLVDYLEKNLADVPEHITWGYLVVFDGRRRQVNTETTTVDHDAGLHYEDDDTEFDPMLLGREDVAPPARLFLRPHLN